MSWGQRRAAGGGLAAFGALAAGLSVAAGAYAAHGLDGADQARLQTAAVFAFGHGLALLMLAPARSRGLGRLAVWLLGLGMTLFSGSLAAAALVDAPTAAAPLGGMAMMLGWLLLAVDSLRR